MSRALALALLLMLSLSAPARAFVLGRYTFRDAAAAAGAATTLVLDLEGARLRARLADASSAIAWELGVDATGPRLGSGVAPLPPCARLHLAVAPRDANGDGVLDAALGESLSLFVTTSLDAAGTASVIAAVDVDAHGARLRWRVDSGHLPALGRVLVAPTPARIHDPVTRRGRAVVVLGSGWPRDVASDVRHSGGTLLVLDAASGAALATPLAGFDAALGGAVTAVDVDADGLDDRLYLADAAGRLWRIDLPRPGAPAARWRAQLLGELSAALPADQAFLQAPDVVRVDTSPAALAITVGSSDREVPSRFDHWLFQLHDSLAEGPVVPVAASDLALDTTATDAASGSSAGAGWRRRLPGSLAAPLLTVDGRLLVVTRHDTAVRCRVGVATDELFTITALDPEGPRGASGHRLTAVTLRAPADAVLVANWTGTDGEPLEHLGCRIGDSPLDLCPALPRLRREWWLRADAP